MNREEIRFLIVSDIHAYDKAHPEFKTDQPSWLDISAPAQKLRNPIVGLSELIKDRSISPDYLICCGDLGHKAHPAAIQNVWTALHAVKTEHKIPSLIATSGNHDLDSRHLYNQYDARGHLQNANPMFPDENEDHSNRFWAQHFTVYEFDEVRLLVLNSAAYHGYQDEFKHGRVADSTLDRIRDRLQKGNSKYINICVCHHHPERHAGVPVQDYSEMKNGARLTSLLASVNFVPWLVIHGHIHFPDLSYAHGGSSSPILFSAGSLAAKLYPYYGGSVRNQAHLITFAIPDIGQFGLCGTFQSWDWTDGLGWSDATKTSGLPARGGFGFRTNPAPFAQRLATSIKKTGRVTFDQLCSNVRELRYLIPRDLDDVMEILKTSHGARIRYDNSGCVDELEIT